MSMIDGFGHGALMDEVTGGDLAAGMGAAPAAPTNAPEPTSKEPVASPAPAENVPQETSQQAPEPIHYEETGNPTLDYVLNYVGGMGIGPDHPAMQAAINGEFDLLGVELAKADAKGATNILAMVQRTYDDMVSKAQAADEELATKVHTIAGGEEQWQQIQTWAAENATPDEKTAINSMFEKGGVEAEIAAAYLAQQYRSTTGTSYEGKPAASPAAAKPAPATGKLSNVEFAQEAQKLYKQYGNDYTRTSEYRALANRMR